MLPDASSDHPMGRVLRVRKRASLASVRVHERGKGRGARERAATTPRTREHLRRNDMDKASVDIERLRERRTARLKTPSDLDERAAKEVGGAMNRVLADVFALYLKTKNFHWHISGPHF